MTKKMLLLLSAIVSLFCCGAATQAIEKKIAPNIIASNNLDALEKLVSQADQNSLVIFDVRSVLINEQDLILQPAYKKTFKALKKKMSANLAKERVEQLNSIILSQKRFALVDRKILTIFEDMRNRKIKFIALTSGSTGRLGHIAKLEDLRITILKNLGIDFSTSYPNLAPLSFANINGKNLKIPMYKAGILFAAKMAKGAVLKQFYEKEKLNLNKIIFIDNQLKNLTSVGDFCKQANINYQGIYYTNIAQKKMPPLNKKVVDYQFKILVEQSKWLGDEEAQAALIENK